MHGLHDEDDVDDSGDEDENDDDDDDVLITIRSASLSTLIVMIDC
jgi:hypothetical protein